MIYCHKTACIPPALAFSTILSRFTLSFIFWYNMGVKNRVGLGSFPGFPGFLRLFLRPCCTIFLRLFFVFPIFFCFQDDDEDDTVVNDDNNNNGGSNLVHLLVTLGYTIEWVPLLMKVAAINKIPGVKRVST
jgi:hypothetical protein